MIKSKSQLGIEIYEFIINDRIIEKVTFFDFIRCNKLKERYPKREKIFRGDKKTNFWYTENMAYSVKKKLLRIGKKSDKEHFLHLKNEIRNNLETNVQKKNLNYFFELVENFEIEFEEKFLAINSLKYAIGNNINFF